MSGYNYGPPPPPPPQAQPQAGHQSYPHHPNPYPSSAPSTRGGSHSRGRGGGGGGGYTGYTPSRPDYQTPSHAPYQYSAYSSQTPAPYGADGSYQSSQWSPEHGHPPPATSHAPAPLSSSNYHPNYAQPAYPQPQYPPHAGYAPPAQPQYPPQYAAGSPATSHWPTPPSQQQQHGGYQGGRHRGGYQNDRGASRTGPAVRMGYREEPPQPATTPGYPASPYQDPRAPAPYAAQPGPQQYHYAPPPPPPAAAATSLPPARHDSRYSQGHGNSRRGGRGGSFRDGNRGGHHKGHGAVHGGGDKQRHKKPNPPAQEPNHVKSEQPAHGKKKKRKVNTLGLTPGDGSGSEDDDEGEEKKLSDLMGGEVIQITDMAAFIAERKKRYPTKARVEAKKAVEVVQKPSGEDRTKRLEREAEKLRRQLKKVESSIKRKREQQDEGDEMRDSSSEEEDGSDADKPEVQSSRGPEGASSAGASAGATTGAAALPTRSGRKTDMSRHCKYYSTGGSCGKKGKCRFVHDPAVREAAIREKEANNGQLTIKQRLILNDKEQEDLTVLESIQYLREKGLVKAESGITSKPGGGAPSGGGNGGADKGKPQGHSGKESFPKTNSAPSTLPGPHSSLPAPPPSLPAPPIKRENGMSPAGKSKSTSPTSGGLYQGWNLGGYGNTGIKPEDLP